jgi:outer membrane protein assembly factor BamD (BamD/ComL family)
MKKIFLLIGILCILSGTPGISHAQTDAELYNNAKLAAKQGDRDFAFMQYHSLMRLSENSPYYHDALFAVGEYYFDMSNYYDAYRTFVEFVELYPRSEALPFAVVYLLKMEQNQQENESEDLEKKVITFKQLSLLFSEYKEYLYTSPLGTKYKAVYFIDKVEIYINEVLFETVYF